MIHKLSFIAFVFLISIGINAQIKVDNKLLTDIKFEKNIILFDKVNEGEEVECDFIFTNTGSENLIISSIKGSCGCTVPSNWSKEPIKPGESSSFHVKFNTENTFGYIEKLITISCNIKNKFKRVKIKGYVEEDSERRKMREEFKKSNINN